MVTLLPLAEQLDPGVRKGVKPLNRPSSVTLLWRYHSPPGVSSRHWASAVLGSEASAPSVSPAMLAFM